MSIFITRITKNGRKYFTLRANIWDRALRAQRQIYLAYLGRQPVLTPPKAKALVDKFGISLAKLAEVKGLKVLSQPVKPKKFKHKMRR